MSVSLKHLTQNASELIAFRVCDQEFCVNIMQVREIRGWTPATPMPHSPSYMLGVINLRGAVLPIIDLAARLGMPPARPDERHVIIVTQIRGRQVGLLVSGVSDILTITQDSIQPTPDISSDFSRQFARGIIAIDNRMICLIELDGLIEETESEAA